MCCLHLSLISSLKLKILSERVTLGGDGVEVLVKIIFSTAFNEDICFTLKFGIAELWDQWGYFYGEIPLHLRKILGVSPKEFGLYCLKLFHALRFTA